MVIAIYGVGYWGDLLVKGIKENYQENIVIRQLITSDGKNEENAYIVDSAIDIDWNQIDYLVISTEKYENEIRVNLLKEFGKVVSNKILSLGEFLEKVEYKFGMGPYQITNTKEGLSFIANYKDTTISRIMKISKKTYSSEMIEAFFTVVNKICDLDNKGYFLDIGANIGTTAIYVDKVINKGLKILAFEPGMDNYNMLKSNCIINKADNVCAYHMGMGLKKEQVGYSYVETNPGGSYITDNECESCEVVNINTIDNFVIESKIEAKDIKYIWLDTEGFEAKILLGGKNTLLQNRIPVLTEFNIVNYRAQGLLEEYCALLSLAYRKFIDMRQIVEKRYFGNTEDVLINAVHDIDEFADFVKMQESQTDLLFL